MEKCEYCQEKKKYFCTWDHICKRECDFELDNDLGYIYYKLKKGYKVNISNDLIRKEVPNFVKVKFDYKEQKIIFKFLQNKPYFYFELKPIHINNAKNCILTKNIKIKIKNSNYMSSMKILGDVNPSSNPIAAVALNTGSLCLFSLVPIWFYSFLQFNELFSYFEYLDIDGGTFYNFLSSIQKSQLDSDYLLIDKNKYYEYQMMLPHFKNLITISIFDYFLCFGIIFFIFYGKYLNNTKYSRYLKRAKLFKKIEKVRENYYKLNFFYKFIYLIKAYYVTFEMEDLLFYYEKLLFSKFIFRIPHYVTIFGYKYTLIEKKFFIFFFLIFFLEVTFLMNYFIKIVQFLKINSISLYKEIMIINEKDSNWDLVHYQFIYFFFNLLIVFVICFFKRLPIICFSIIFLIILIEISFLIFYFKKKYRAFFILNFFTIFSFLLWVIFVFIKKFFYWESFWLLNIFYLLANLLKFISGIVLSCTLKKLKRFLNN